jgi:hypothetical protein
MNQASLFRFDDSRKKRMFKVKYKKGKMITIHFIKAYDISEVKLHYKDFNIIEVKEVG